MQELAARVERHYKFSKQELFRLFITALVAAFGMTISEGWGFFNIIKEQSLINYFINTFIVFILIFVSLFIHFSIQKIVGLKLGYVSDYTYWMNGFLMSTFFCFISFGFIPLFFTGSIWPKVNTKLRMGRFRYGAMHKDLGIIAFSGPLTSMILAAIASPIYVATENPIIYAFIVSNLLVGLYSLIPIPTFEGVRDFQGGTTGLYIFIASRWTYVFTIFFVLFYSLLILIAQIFSLILAFLIGALIAFLYYKNYESL